MARIRQQVLQEPTATPVAGQTVRVRREDTHLTLFTLTTDINGFVDWTYDGHPGPFYLHAPGAPGGDKYWASEDAGGAGPLVLRDIPAGLFTLGDGVIAGLEEELEVTVAGSNGIGVAQGAALVGGIPVVNYIADIVSVTRPTTATRIDRVTIRVYTPEDATFPSQSGIVVTLGTEGGSAPASTNTATMRETTLALVTVPVAANLVVTDARTYVGPAQDVAGIARDAEVTTTSATGEALGDLEVTLSLPLPVTYDIIADVTAEQTQEPFVGGWELTATYGSLGSGTAPNFNTPGQVAVAPDGVFYVADTANNRVVSISAAGSHVAARTGLSNPTGVAVDSSGGIYVSDDDGMRKYASAAAFLAGTTSWTNTTLDYLWPYLTADATHLYAIQRTPTGIYRAIRYWLGTGSPDGGLATGSLTVPRGILVSGGSVYISEGGSADRIRKVTTAGTAILTWGSTGTGDGKFNEPRGLAADSSGNIWVADYGNDRVQRFTTSGVYSGQFAQADGDGIAADADDALWVADAGASTLTKWSANVPETAGYGEVAIEIDGAVSAYIGIGDREELVANSAEGTATGVGEVTVRAFGKATAGMMVLAQAALTARAIPRR
jgi:hypothetical protein